MENIVAHSLEKLYTEFEKADQFFLDSAMPNMVSMAVSSLRPSCC